MSKVALITGITGQDGSYLAELLLKKGYVVHGMIRRSSSLNTGRIDHIFESLHLYYGDMTDSLSIDNIVYKVKPDEIYHLGAQSHVRVSFDMPKYTGEVDGLGTLYMLEAIRRHCPKAKFYNASTSELYGAVQETPQTELTPFNPQSPYGVAKLYAYWIVRNYREAYNMFAVNGILFNHESKRRGETFITKKAITKLVKMIRGSHFEPLCVGNLEAKRDWGYAPEYVEGMWRMLQQDKPDDFVLATGQVHSVRELIEEICKHLNLDLSWRGEGVEEVGWSGLLEKNIVKVNQKYFRPLEVRFLQGDASKASKVLGWKAKVQFKTLIKIMIDNV